MTFSLPDLSKQALRRRGIEATLDEMVEFVIACLHGACALVAEDTSTDRYDDATSRGFLRWRRARNLIFERIAEEGPQGARAVDVQNALRILERGYVLSFYSAPNGAAHPDLSGSSKAKRNLVDEMQLQLNGMNGTHGPTQFALFYEADELGLTHAVAGVLSSAHEWHWRVTAFEREEGQDETADRGGARPPSHPSYDQQPVTDLPPLYPKKKPGEEKQSPDLSPDES